MLPYIVSNAITVQPERRWRKSQVPQTSAPSTSQADCVSQGRGGRTARKFRCEEPKPNYDRREKRMNEKSTPLTGITTGEGVGRVELCRRANPGIIRGKSASRGRGCALGHLVKAPRGEGVAEETVEDRKSCSSRKSKTATRRGQEAFMTGSKLIFPPDTSLGEKTLGRDMGVSLVRWQRG